MYIQKYKYSSHPNTTVREQCDMQEDTVGSFAGKGWIQKTANKITWKRLDSFMCLQVQYETLQGKDKPLNSLL